MSAEVYFAQRRATGGGGLMEKVEQLLEAAGFVQAVLPGDRVAIKVHFGERGNTTYVRPEILRRIVSKVRRQEAHPFVTDTNARESQTRSDAVRHLAAAAAHGFSQETLGAPVIIADGLDGRDGVSVATGSGAPVAVASAIAHADALIVVNHVTFHPEVGFVGALYHLGFGALTRAFRLEFQSAPSLVAAGPPSSLVPLLAEPIAEAFAAVMAGKPGKVIFCNALLDITPDPDGASWSDAAVLPDVGLLVSRDAVALDQATADFLNMQVGLPGTRLADVTAADKIRALVPAIDWTELLKAVERKKLGSRDYELLII